MRILSPVDTLAPVVSALAVAEVPTKAHKRIAFLIAFYLESWAQKTDGGTTLGSGYKVRISEKRGLMPDVQLAASRTWSEAVAYSWYPNRMNV
jgi:hypothetical protein